ncbi:MAG: formylglycine-generating enzyme family protein [Bacteroidaceae bacterium]|nr:formylglycine-generating enzyme family protein [Bacteroidaceae bacterium]
MKKFRYIASALLLGALLPLTFASCGSSDDDEDKKDPTENKSDAPDELYVDIWSGSIREVIRMVKVEGGTFRMGNADGSYYESPEHDVTLSDYYIGMFEVRQDEWELIMGGNPSYLTEGQRRLPVESVSWNDCQEFIKKLNEKTGLTFRLPTEAEWEFAARGGTKSKGYLYSGSSTIGDVAWYEDNTEDTHTVGRLKANELGLFDMTGNVEEWCQDWMGSYSASAQTNPTGPVTGTERVLRGGAANFAAKFCTTTFRTFAKPDQSGNFRGFRLAMSI